MLPERVISLASMAASRTRNRGLSEYRIYDRLRMSARVHQVKQNINHRAGNCGHEPNQRSDLSPLAVLSEFFLVAKRKCCNAKYGRNCGKHDMEQ